MQHKYMPTNVFLRLEKEWQHMRQAECHLEIEAGRPSDQRPDGATELGPASVTQTQQRS
jgi:hypothetical protein